MASVPAQDTRSASGSYLSPASVDKSASGSVKEWKNCEYREMPLRFGRDHLGLERLYVGTGSIGIIGAGIDRDLPLHGTRLRGFVVFSIP